MQSHKAPSAPGPTLAVIMRQRDGGNWTLLGLGEGAQAHLPDPPNPPGEGWTLAGREKLVHSSLLQGADWKPGITG